MINKEQDIFCPHCNTYHPRGTQFCPNTGKLIKKKVSSKRIIVSAVTIIIFIISLAVYQMYFRTAPDMELEEPIINIKKKQDDKANQKIKENIVAVNKKPAETLEQPDQDQIKNALERLKASVSSKKNEAKSTNSGGNDAAGAADVGSSGGVGEVSSLTLYQIKIKHIIEQNWIFNNTIAGLNKDLEVKIFIKVLKSGEIRDIAFETRSGNNYLDESAKKAIQKANPLPELPHGMASYEVVLGFSPLGFTKNFEGKPKSTILATDITQDSLTR